MPWEIYNLANVKYISFITGRLRSCVFLKYFSSRIARMHFALSLHLWSSQFGANIYQSIQGDNRVSRAYRWVWSCLKRRHTLVTVVLGTDAYLLLAEDIIGYRAVCLQFQVGNLIRALSSVITTIADLDPMIRHCTAWWAKSGSST